MRTRGAPTATLFPGAFHRPAMGLLGKVFGVLGFLILVLVGLAAYLYFTDYEAKATVTDKGQDENGPYVVVTPNLLRFLDVEHSLTQEQANFVCVGYEVAFRVQTKHFQVFDDRGTLVYDSEDGLQDSEALLRCGASNAGNDGGILSAL